MPLRQVAARSTGLSLTCSLWIMPEGRACLSEDLSSPSDIKIIYQNWNVNRKPSFSLFFFSPPHDNGCDRAAHPRLRFPEDMRPLLPLRMSSLILRLPENTGTVLVLPPVLMSSSETCPEPRGRRLLTKEMLPAVCRQGAFCYRTVRIIMP